RAREFEVAVRRRTAEPPIEPRGRGLPESRPAMRRATSTKIVNRWMPTLQAGRHDNFTILHELDLEGRVRLLRGGTSHLLFERTSLGRVLIKGSCARTSLRKRYSHMASQPTQQIPGVYHRKIGDIVVTAISDGYLDGGLDVMRNVDLDAAHR